MSKEKLTVEGTIQKIYDIGYVSEYIFFLNAQEITKNLLKQIRDELYNKATPFEDSSGYIYSKTLFMSEVDEVFSKYLNEN